MHFYIDHLLVTTIIILVALIGVPFLLRLRFPKRTPNEDDGARDEPATAPVTGTAPPPPKVVVVQTTKTDRFASPPAKRKGWYRPDVLVISVLLLFGLVEGLFWVRGAWPLLWSAGTGQQANRHNDGPHSPSGVSLAPEHADYGPCTEPPKKGVLISKGEVTKIDTPLGCVVNLDLTPAEVGTLIDLSCTDLHGDEHEEWSEEFCTKYEVLGIKLKGNAPTDSRKVNITFTGPRA